LAFFNLMPNSRNLAFFKVVCHEKMLFGKYVIVWHVAGLFQWCWQKKRCLAFHKNLSPFNLAWTFNLAWNFVTNFCGIVTNIRRLCAKFTVIKNYDMGHICIFMTCISLVQRLVSILLGIFYKRRWYFWRLTLYLFICNKSVFCSVATFFVLLFIRVNQN